MKRIVNSPWWHLFTDHAWVGPVAIALIFPQLTLKGLVFTILQWAFIIPNTIYGRISPSESFIDPYKGFRKLDMFPNKLSVAKRKKSVSPEIVSQSKAISESISEMYFSLLLIEFTLIYTKLALKACMGKIIWIVIKPFLFHMTIKPPLGLSETILT